MIIRTFYSYGLDKNSFVSVFFGYFQIFVNILQHFSWPLGWSDTHLPLDHELCMDNTTTPTPKLVLAATNTTATSSTSHKQSVNTINKFAFFFSSISVIIFPFHSTLLFYAYISHSFVCILHVCWVFIFVLVCRNMLCKYAPIKLHIKMYWLILWSSVIWKRFCVCVCVCREIVFAHIHSVITYGTNRNIQCFSHYNKKLCSSDIMEKLFIFRLSLSLWVKHVHEIYQQYRTSYTKYV